MGGWGQCFEGDILKGRAINKCMGEERVFIVQVECEKMGKISDISVNALWVEL